MPILEMVNRITGGGPTGSGPFYNVMHFNVATADSAAANAIIAPLKTYYTAVAALQNTGTTTSVGWKAVDISSVPHLLVATAPQNVAGTTGGGDAPAQICLVTSWRTAVASRHGRGRTFHGPMGLGSLVTTGLFVTSLTTAIQTAANALIPALLALPGATSLCIVQKGPGGNVINSVNVTSAATSTQPYTQRRRSL